MQRIRAKGGVCQSIADRGLSLLGAGHVQYYPAGGYSFGGFAKLGGTHVYLEDTWVEYWSGTIKSSDGRNLDYSLVHELDHHLGSGLGTDQVDAQGHLRKPDGSVDKYHTLNSHGCS